MKLGNSLVAALALLSVVVGACSSKTEPSHVQVFAATSLRESCEEIGKLWEARHTWGPLSQKVVFNFGASNALAQQIVASHGADVFISADLQQLEVVRKAGLVVDASAPGWLSNQLVVVVPSARADVKIESAADLGRPEFTRLSLANPDAVPAGKYAKAWLESKGAWKSVEGRVVAGVDVRAALAAVESEAADIGIVYSTDAVITDRVRVALRVPLAEGPKIEYAIATLQGPAGRDSITPQPNALVEFFHGDEAKKVFERRGFIVGAAN